MRKKLIAFHGDPEIKEKYLARLRAHAEVDEIVKGYYWQNGKGCAVGCTVHSGDHYAYETELGIPRQLARIEDGIFEGLPNETAKEWPLRFLGVIPIGADLYPAYWRFMQWLLVDQADGVIRFARSKKTLNAVNHVGGLYARLIAGDSVSQQERHAAAYADADAAADVAAAYDAAAYAYAAAAAAGAYAAGADADAYAAAAADAAAYAYAAAAYAAADAADAAAYAGTYAAAAAGAYAAADAAAVVAGAYAAGYAAGYAAADGRVNARIKQSEKLLELLAATPVGVE